MKSFLAILLLLLSISKADAIYYADITRPDDTANCTQAQTLATAKKFIMSAVRCMSSAQGSGANQIVEVAAGTYTENLMFRVANGELPSGTSWNAPFTLRARAGSTVTIRSAGTPGENQNNLHISSTWPLFAIISGFVFDGSLVGNESISIGDADYGSSQLMLANNRIINNGASNGLVTDRRATFLQIINNRFENSTWGTPGDTSCGQPACYAYPIYHGSSDSIIRGNVLRNFPSWGIHVYSGNPAGPFPSRNTIDNNVLHDFGYGDPRSSAIAVTMGSGNRVANNRVYRSSSKGIQAGTYDTTTEVWNNTIYNVPNDACIELSNTADVRNNICVNTLTKITASGGTRAKNFADIAGTGIEIVGNARFADPNNGDFRLCRTTGSPHASCGATPSDAIDVGVYVGLTSDAVGSTVPQGALPDVGALEAAAIPPGTCPATPGLVAQYTFDGDFQDTSGNANHGSAGGGVTYEAFGKFGQAASFNGTEAVVVADSTSLWICDGFTIGAWIKPATVMTDFRAIAVKNYKYYLYASSHSYFADGAMMGGYLQGTYTQAGYNTVFAQDVWAYAAITYDKNNIRLWVNGVNVTSAPGTATLDQTAGSLQIGGSQNGEYFNGLIDQVRVYNYARSGAELIEDMGLGAMVTNKFGAVARKYGAGVVRKFGFVQ